MIDSIIIVSGGMDSVTLLHYLIKYKHKTPAIITFLYNQKHCKEVHCAKENTAILNCNDHLILDLSMFSTLFDSSALVSSQIEIPDMRDVIGDPQPPTYVPNRNMIFLSLAAAYAEKFHVSDIYYGAQKHDEYGYWDTSPQFLERLNNVFGLNRKTPVQVKAPFVNYSKADILKLGISLEVDYTKTWSCYKGDTFACGSCPTCIERLKAFSDIGLKDPLLYKASRKMND
jgi:7-cyano-7-deazaguanine synthase